MSRKKLELQKHTLNLRPGDFNKMGELFLDMDPSSAIRTLISRFVDRHYTVSPKLPQTEEKHRFTLDL